MKKIRKQDAVSEVMGTIILLGMTIALFSFFLLIAFSFQFEPSTPSSNLIGSVDQNTIIIEHCGGESLSLDSRIIFRINDTEFNRTALDILDINTSNGNNLWDIGEKLSYNPGFNISRSNIDIFVLDPESNSIIMMAVIQHIAPFSIFTHIDMIIPYNQIASPLIITASGDSKLDNVTLWYRYSYDGISWSSYLNFNTDDNSPWEWNFNFPDGVGYYEFYSIGKIIDVEEEVLPDADTSCRYGHYPIITNPYPTDGADDVILNPTLGITISDVDGDLMTITWYSNSSGSWQILGTNSSVGNGTYNMSNTAFNNYNTTYWWRVNVNDEMNMNTQATFDFTTIGNKKPTINLINPINGSEDVILQPLCQIWVNDTDGDILTVYWYENSSGSYNLRNTDSGVSANSTVSYTFTQFTNYNTNYYWKVIVNDSKESTTAWYYFKTQSINTCVDTISPYIVTTSPLTITATGQSNLDNVTLYYRYSKDNLTWGTLNQKTIFDGFEDGVMNTSLWNTYQIGGDARIQFNYGTSQSGSYSCAMDDADSDTGDYSLNELYTVYDFTGVSNINIDFWELDSADETENPPSSWIGHGNYDAVAFTNDGTTWYTIFNGDELDNSGWEHFTYNISSHPNFNPNVNSNFSIKFQQYDNYQLTSDGRLWDDIQIDFTIDSGISWTAWNDTSNPDTSSPWSWSFNFSDGLGYYEFYSIGKHNGVIEETPIIADAMMRFYNQVPEISNPSPANGSLNISPNPPMSITVSDVDGDILTVYWYENSTGSYILRNTDSGVNANSTISYTFTQFTNYNTSYYWKIVVDDSKENNSVWYYFTTEPISTSVDTISPYIVTTSPLTITATGQSNLDNVTLYYQWSDDNISWNGGMNEIKDPVDSNTSDVDSSTDKGLETNFPNAQGITPDSHSMTIQEVTQIVNENYNDIDNYGDIYPPSEIGTHSSFIEMQDLDGIYDTISESYPTNQVTYVSAGTGSGLTSGNPTPGYPTGLVVDDLILLQVTLRDDDSPVTITPPIGFTLLYGPDTSGGTSSQVRQWIYYKFSDGTESGTITVTVTGSNDDRAARMYAFRNVALTDFTEGGEFLTDYDIIVDAPTVTTTGTGRLAVSFCSVGDNIGIDSFSGESGGDWIEAAEYQFNGDDDMCMQLQTVTMTSAGTISGGDDNIGSTERWVVRGFALKPIQLPYYSLDLEVRWTSADNDETNEYLCIYGGIQDQEGLQVDVWNGVEWTTVISNLSSGWNNVSVSTYLTSSNFYIRFKDTIQDNDTLQSSWQIEGVRLHTWSTPNVIDFEYQWTAANYNQVNELLCFYFSSHTGGTENLRVYYWTGSTWSQLGTITNLGWSNFTAVGLTSSTYTIRLLGDSESGDSTQDIWNIDVIMLHTWNITGGSHGHNWIPWIDSNNPDTSSPWSWSFNFPDGLGYYEFYSIGKHNGVIEETPMTADASCYYSG
jgi:uncharacterized protein (DUF427 family)